ncbi:MAG TPA: MFS transporter [Tepidisphaeraceae bacterium]|jgi:DHA1 family multidrug resistance protein-like MFS transporter|nr:MFS transporter [Tepidisphaeraceae bacterium]
MPPRTASPRTASPRSHPTLGLCTILHGFTHAYGSMLVPLYFRIAEDLKLSGVGAATLIVTLYGATYNLGSWTGGVAADRFSRKTLLAIGLFGNAAAILGIGLSREYPAILALAMAAGIFGAIFHPAANALATSHYPKSPGMAIGILGIGSGLGFFFGPQIAGWRAASARWHFANVAQWQKPCVEMAIAGFLVGIIFLLVARDPDGARVTGQSRKMDPSLRRKMVRLALVLMFRDFAGVAGLSLAAIYVRNVFGLSVGEAGLFVGIMMLPSVIVNPLAVYLTPRRRRLPGLTTILIAGGLIVATTPMWGVHGALVILCAFQTMQLASYAVSDAATLERVSSHVRGRVVGLFLLIAGTFGATGPWAMGSWTDRLAAAHVQASYAIPFALLGACMLIASMAPRLIGRLGPVLSESPMRPAQEISPETMGAVP